VASDAKRCPKCGAELTENVPEGFCPHCVIIDGLAKQTPGSTDATVAWTPEPTDITGTASGQGESGSLPRGTTVRYFGDYELQNELGRGGMGVVYKAKQVSLNRPVALKVIRAGVLADDGELRRFQNEAESVALLDHPSIVPVYEVGAHDGQRYFSMKLIPGANLAERLAAYRQRPADAALLLADAAEAVHHAHMRGVLHRDLKPANILVDAAGRPHVTDFGLAKRVEAAVELTASGAILGTPAYMSPEQAAGGRGSITTATDVHGLGAILYALLTGRAPFASDSVVDTLTKVKEHPPEPPRRINEHAPRELEVIALKCLEKDPGRRYASAQALADDLRAWLEGRPIAARPVRVTTRLWMWCKRKPLVAALAASLILALSSGIAVGCSQWSRAERNYRETVAANRELKTANANLQSSMVAERAASRQAVARFEIALQAIERYYSSVNNDVLLKKPEFKELRNKLLTNALQFYQRLKRDLSPRQEDLGLRQALVDAAMKVASLTRSVGTAKDAIAAYEEAIPLLEALDAELPVPLKPRNQLTDALVSLSRLRAATGADREARAANRKARDLPGAPNFQLEALRESNAAMAVLNKHGHGAEDKREAERIGVAALAFGERALELSPRDESIVSAFSQHLRELRELQLALDDPVGAIATSRKLIALHDGRLSSDPRSTGHRSMVGFGHSELGRALEVAGRLDDAMVSYRTAISLLESSAQPAGVDFLYAARARARLGRLLSTIRRDDSNESQAELDHAMAALRRAAVAGFRSVAAIESDDDLQPLRGRRDFQDFLLDLPFPAEPFVARQ
jgi:serine/threonine protein kinase/tetratricopeptide (TPR) repeat protein